MSGDYTFIWDLDGTLFDSYKIIVPCMQQALEENGLRISEHIILYYAISRSLRDFMSEIESTCGISAKKLDRRSMELRDERMFEITLMPHAKDILRFLRNKGVKNYVFTHRGKSTISILKHLEIDDYFDEIITSLDGFARKPAPDGLNYFISKYDLDLTRTFYVGDREIDMACARNANVRSILYLPPDGVGEETEIEEFVIHDLMDIRRILGENYE